MKSSIKINFEKNYVSLAIFCLPVLAFCLDPAYKSYSVFVLISYAVSYFICFLNPIFTVPFFIISLIISPLWFDFSESFIATNLAPLVYLIIFIVFYRIRLSVNVLILCLLFLLLGFMSFAFSDYLKFLYPALLNLIVTTFLISVAFTLSEIKNGAQSVNQLLVHTSFFCSVVLGLLIIASVWQSINLADFHAIGRGLIYEPDPYNKLLFNQGFFYNNIFFALGIFVLIMFEDICFGTKSLIKVFYFSLGLIGFIFLLNKSAILSLFVSILLMCFMNMKTLINYSKSFAFYVIGGFLGIITCVVIFSDGVKYILHLGSFLMRLQVAGNVFEFFKANPMSMFFGIGPEALIRAPDTQFQELALLKKTSAGIEGTVDSFILTLLVENGAFFVVFLIAIFTNIFFRSKSTFKESSDFKLIDPRPIIFYVTLLCVTQTLTFSKIGWIVCLLIFIPVFLNRKVGSQHSFEKKPSGG